jgi:8-oxo-dGTP pyrophosphatase MutT (NUDIX family)
MSARAVSSVWPALAAARRVQRPRRPFHLRGRVVGSVAVDDLPWLEPWQDRLRLTPEGCHWTAPPAVTEEAMAELHAALRDAGRITAWRDETFPLLDPVNGEVLGTLERAAARFWGLLTRGAHGNGYVCADSGAPDRPTHLWIARRAAHKATDPGCLDNLVGGGVPFGQSPLETLQREAFEEAGLLPHQLSGLRPGRVLRIDADVPQGRMVEDLHTFDLPLPPGLVPVNQDGEVSEIRCLPVEEALVRAATGEMTTDAALVTLDFALRHQLLPAADAARLGPALDALRAAPAPAGVR